MASSNDLRDIMGMEKSAPQDLTREMLLSADKARKTQGRRSEPIRRPEGMARELYNLLYNDSKDAPPVIPTDTPIGGDMGYKQMKAKLGMRKVRPWKWMAFTNPARKDNLVLNHWRRVTDEGKEYPFARFNKKIEIPSYTDDEYNQHLNSDSWSRAETDHLFELCQRFDLRFIVIQDRWDRLAFKTDRSVEDIKERYYGICEKLEMLHVDPAKVTKPFVYDADHERKRKEQLKRLYNRTPEQIEEEEMLKLELRKIEARKKEREKKTQDLQKLIAQADSSAVFGIGAKGGDKKASSGGSSSKKKSAISGKSPTKDLNSALESSAIKFPDQRVSGVTLRSQRMKLPQSVAQKRSKAMDLMLQELGVDLNPIPTDEICTEFNELRKDLNTLCEYKITFTACESEMQSLKAQFETLCPGKSLEIPDKLKPSSTFVRGEKSRNVADVIDVGNGASSSQPSRKRKAALEQSNVLKKIKNKNF